MSNVIKMKADEPLPDEPDKDMIAAIEKLLADAKSGELRAFAYATMRRQNVAGTGWNGTAGTGYPLGAVIAMLNTRYSMALLEPGVPVE